MGIKSLTVVLDDAGNDICVIYRGIDGHLTGHGADLREFLRGYLVIRKFRPDDRPKVAAGMGRVAAHLIAKFAAGIGGSDLLPSGTRDQGEVYVYTVYARHAVLDIPSILNLRIEVRTGSTTANTTVIYDGLLDEFDIQVVQAQWKHGIDEIDHVLNDPIPLTHEASAS